MASNSGDSSPFVLKSSLNGGSLLAATKSPLHPAYMSLAQITVENIVSNSTSIVAWESVRLPSLCNGSTSYNMYLHKN
jgi:hypothetical protein